MKTLKALVLIGAAVLTFSTMQKSTAAFGTTTVDGATTFKSKCASCHAVDGSGNTPIGRNLKIGDLGSAAIQAKSNAQLAKLLPVGRARCLSSAPV
ncbi:MAG: c-type cytochrome [Acidobacteria bacterium]|nr:c-type cytochrome [Acidobacteriota bacterium]